MYARSITDSNAFVSRQHQAIWFKIITSKKGNLQIGLDLHCKLLQNCFRQTHCMICFILTIHSMSQFGVSWRHIKNFINGECYSFKQSHLFCAVSHFCQCIVLQGRHLMTRQTSSAFLEVHVLQRQHCLSGTFNKELCIIYEATLEMLSLIMFQISIQSLYTLLKTSSKHIPNSAGEETEARYLNELSCDTVAD